MEYPLEKHPWAPYTPASAKVLFLGTFPPPQKRWAMDFYYPNPTNDFWRIMGLLFLGNPDALYIKSERSYRLDDIKQLLNSKGIALADTGFEIRRLKGNASDAHLQIVTPLNLSTLIDTKLPQCQALATTGEKAATVLAELTSSQIPPIGQHTDVKVDNRILTHFRLPSSSRAYPLALDKKAAFYRDMFIHLGIISPPTEKYVSLHSENK